MFCRRYDTYFKHILIAYNSWRSSSLGVFEELIYRIGYMGKNCTCGLMFLYATICKLIEIFGGRIVGFIKSQKVIFLKAWASFDTSTLYYFFFLSKLRWYLFGNSSMRMIMFNENKS